MRVYAATMPFRHQSLAFDVAILIRTLAVMLRLAGR